MGKDKLRRWKENEHFHHVYEPSLQEVIKGMRFMNGQWHSEVFKNDHPIVLELGCGKGEYSVGLARMFPEKNFLGVDIKGHRFWKGAKESLQAGMDNIAFLRTRIEFIGNFFEPGEVDEIWLTFSDPQPKDDKGAKRLSSPKFIDRYKKFLKPGASINLKTDNTGLYLYTLSELQRLNYKIEFHTDDVYAAFIKGMSQEWQDILSIRTHYETLFMAEGEKIKFIRFSV